MGYTNKQLEFGKKFRENWMIETNNKGSFLDVPWENLNYEEKSQWAQIYFNVGETDCKETRTARDKVKAVPVYNDLIIEAEKAVEEAEEVMSKFKEEKEMTDSYTFIANREDIDFQRILNESNGSRFVVVQLRSRDNRIGETILFVNKSVLNDKRVEGFPLANVYVADNKVNPSWGNTHPDGERKLRSYRYWAFAGSAPKELRQQIQNIKDALKVRDTKVVVNLL